MRHLKHYKLYESADSTYLDYFTDLTDKGVVVEYHSIGDGFCVKAIAKTGLTTYHKIKDEVKTCVDRLRGVENIEVSYIYCKGSYYIFNSNLVLSFKHLFTSLVSKDNGSKEEVFGSFYYNEYGKLILIIEDNYKLSISRSSIYNNIKEYSGVDVSRFSLAIISILVKSLYNFTPRDFQLLS